MALQDRMPWKTLAMLLNDVAPTLNETREVITISQKELETLQSTLQEKEKQLEKYQNDSFTFESHKSDDEVQNYTLETETIPKNIQEIEQQSFIELETETMDDEIEILEVVKDEENYLDINECSKPYQKNENENDEHDSGEAYANEFLNEIDNAQ